MSQEEKAKMVLDDLADRLPEMFDMEDIRSRVDEVTPYVMVAIQVGAAFLNLELSADSRNLHTCATGFAPLAVDIC